jgi:hypothetical protein
MLALAVAAVLSAIQDSKSSSAVLRGDFPAFYSLAAIAASDNPQRLYDLNEQTRIQNEAWPDMKGSVLPAAYPPYVAYLAQPLVTLGPVGGKVALTLVSLVTFFIAAHLMSRLGTALRGTATEVSVLLLLFPPVLMGVIGGQLLAMSMVLYVITMALDRRRDGWSEILLGVIIGIWLFKPHYALLALLLPLSQGRLRVVIGFMFPALLYYALGAEVLGIDWPAKWMLFTRDFAEINYASNAAQMSNLVGATLAFSKALQLEPPMMALGRAVALGACGLVVLGLALIAWRDRSDLPARNGMPSRALLVLGPVLAFASPQANFYDLGLAIIPLILLMRPTVRDWMLHIGPCIVGGFIAVSCKDCGVPLFAILSLALFVTVVQRVLVVRDLEGRTLSTP